MYLLKIVQCQRGMDSVLYNRAFHQRVEASGGPLSTLRSVLEEEQVRRVPHAGEWWKWVTRNPYCCYAHICLRCKLTVHSAS